MIDSAKTQILFHQAKKIVENRVGKFMPLQVWVRKGWPEEEV